jgi:uncharacterized phage infection (PIP) family protein YhgE
MEILKKALRNKLFILGILIPWVFQIVYLCIAIPAVKDGNTGIYNLKIAIVNEDNGAGKSVAAKLGQVLPFKTEMSNDLSSALKDMDDDKFNMVVYLAGDFSATLAKGNAQIQYYINQSTPGMTKQLMERTAISINQTLNEGVFLEGKDAIKKGSTASISQAGLPDSASTLINNKLGQALDSLKYTSIKGNIQKVNNAEGFVQTVFPFFIFLTYFVGAIIMTGLHSVVFKSLRIQYSKNKIWLSKLVINISAALVMPCIVIGLAACFDIPFALGTGTAWLLLSAGFLTLIYLIQMFSEWFGIPGMGIAALLFFPLQLVTSGLMYSQEILLSLYSTISNYLPATYFGDGMIKLFYNGASVYQDVGILILMSVIFIAITALTLLKSHKTPVTSIE